MAEDRTSIGGWESVEEISQVFKAAWRAKPMPSLTSFVPRHGHPLRHPALIRLVSIDIDARWRSAQPILVEAYLQAWPELREGQAAVRDLLAAECLSRATYAGSSDRSELQARFPLIADSLDLAAIETQASATRKSSSYLGSERFFVLRQLGRGGCGVVYAALDRQRNQVVALKILPDAQPESLYYFKHEFRGLAEMAHPHLAVLYELLSVGGNWFFTMEVIEGVDFLTYVRAADPTAEPTDLSPLVAGQISSTKNETEVWPGLSTSTEQFSKRRLLVSYDTLRDLLQQLADSLNFLHQHGTLHLDIKPSNVMVRRDGRLVVLDFGLTTRLVEGTVGPEISIDDGPADFATGDAAASTDHAVAGTTAYISPEQAAGQPLTKASDWYAVGVMLYLALTGKLPFSGSRRNVLKTKQERDPTDPRQLNAEIPQDLYEMCLGLLNRDPRARWSSDQVQQILAKNNPHTLPNIDAFPRFDIPFVGRGEQLEVLQRAFDEVCSGSTRVVHVSGESGAGKSRLVGHFLRGLNQRHGVVILEGRCYESESVPYKALDSVIDALSRFLRAHSFAEVQSLLPADVGALASIFPVLKRVKAISAAAQTVSVTLDVQESRRRAFTALRDLLINLGQRYAVVLAIDDLQWGDADSAAVLAELLRPPDPPRLLLLVLYRREYRGQSACLGVLTATDSRAGQGAQRRDLHLGRLSHLESQQMAAGLLADSDRSVAETIATQSQGMPYFILEMVQHVRAGTDVRALTALDGTLALDAVLWTRVKQLPAPTQQLLEAVAVAGQPLELRVVLDALQLSPADYAQVGLLRSHHLVRTFGPGLDDPIGVYHDRIRESVVANLPENKLVAHHGRLAAALERSPAADAERIAVHYHGAGQAERAGQFFASAAEAAQQKLAFDRAARLYEQAFGLLPLDETAQRAMLTKWADALANAGRGGEAAKRYQAATVGVSQRERLELQRRAAYQYCISGHVDEGRAALQALLFDLNIALPRTPTWSLISLLANRFRLFVRGTRFCERREENVPTSELNRIDTIWMASAGLSMFDVVAGADFQARGCLLALRAGEPSRLARALAWEAAHTSNMGGSTWKRTQRLLDEARHLAEDVREPYALGWVTLCEGLANFTNGGWQIAHLKMEQAERTLRDECTGVAWELGTAHAFNLWSLFYLGELAEMSTKASRLVAEARERGDQYAATTHSAFSLPMGQLTKGDHDAARQTIDEALGHWSRVGFHVQHIIGLMCHTYVDLYCGHGEEAWRRMTEQWPQVVRSQLLRVQVLRSFLVHLRARSALAAARSSRLPGPLLRAARRDADSLLRERMPYCMAHANHLLAAIAILQGDHERGTDLLRGTVEGYEKVGMNLFAAATRRRLGRLVGGDEGGNLLDQANAFLSRQGVVDLDRMADAVSAWMA